MVVCMRRSYGGPCWGPEATAWVLAVTSLRRLVDRETKWRIKIYLRWFRYCLYVAEGVAELDGNAYPCIFSTRSWKQPVVSWRDYSTFQMSFGVCYEGVADSNRNPSAPVVYVMRVCKLRV